MAIVSAFVLTACAVDVLGDCCGWQGQEQADHCDCAPGDPMPDNGDDCQCLCHVILTPLTTGPLWVADAVFVPADFVAQKNEFPPDAVPLGIDHPPQIA